MELKAWFVGVAGQVVGLPLYLAAPLMFIVAVADSSLLSIPEINDIVTVTRIVKRPEEVWYFPIFPALGSMVGCYFLYRLARGGHDIVTRRFHPRVLARADELFGRWGLLALVIPALLPPPLPFKVFVATAGALGYPARRFLAAIGLARLARYYFWGILAYFFREEVLQILDLLKSHFNEVLLFFIVIAGGLLIGRWVLNRIRAGRKKTIDSLTE